MRHREVVVVGGGVVGLNVAYFLRQRGVRVTVLERDRVGSGASRGNAGEICPDLASPWPAPGMVRQGLGNLYRRDSGLYIAPRLSSSLAGFLWGFWRNSTPAARARGLALLSTLGRPTRALFRELAAAGIVETINDAGHLYVYSSQRSAEERHDDVRARLGERRTLVGELLDADGLRTHEPGLGSAARSGFLVRDQWAIDPGRFVDNLVASLRADGVEIVEGARVTEVDDERRPVLVRSSAQTVGADAVVIAAGVGSREVCRRLGVRMPVFPGKGYSFDVPAERPPSRVIRLEDANVAVTPMSGRVRVAGTVELDPYGDRFNPNRITAMVAAAGPYLDSVDWQARAHEWMGPRPMTPSGLPAVGPVAHHPSVYVAAGHNKLGLMFAPATGKAVADLVVDGRTWFGPAV